MGYPEEAGKDGTVNVTFKDNIAIVTMNCGENRFNRTFIKRMHEALDKVERNPNVHAMITTGTGKFFSNGLDLQWLKIGEVDEETRFFEIDFPALLMRIMTFPMPTIAAINGHAFAGGCLLAMTHDFRVMRTKIGWLCMNEVRIKYLIPDVLTAILRTRLPGGNVFHEIVNLSKPFTGEEAEQAGIVSKACDENNLLNAAFDIVNNILKPGPYDRTALQNMKKDMFKHITKLQQEQAQAHYKSKL